MPPVVNDHRVILALWPAMRTGPYCLLSHQGIRSDLDHDKSVPPRPINVGRAAATSALTQSPPATSIPDPERIRWAHAFGSRSWQVPQE